MELAFWDPMTVGDLSAPLPDGLVADSTAGGEAMKAVGSMGFEEMLQWMETDPGKDDLASFSGTPIPWNSEGGATVPTPSDDFRAMLSHALTSPEDVNSAVSDSTHLSTTALSSSSAMFSGLMPSSEQQQFARVTAGSSMQFQRQRNLQYLPIMSQALGDNLEIDISSPFAGHMQQTNMHSISLPQQMPFALNPLEQHQQMMLQQAQIAQQQQHLHLQQLQLQQQMQGQQPLVSLFAPVDSSALQQQHAPAILDNLDFGQLDSPFLVHEQYLTAPRPTTTMMQILQHTPTNVTSSPAVSGERSQGSMPLMTDGDKSSHADLSFLEQQVQHASIDRAHLAGRSSCWCPRQASVIILCRR